MSLFYILANPPLPLPDQRPRAWVDENNVVVIRGDVPAEEAAELSEMLRQAFNAGVRVAYNYTRTRAA